MENDYRDIDGHKLMYHPHEVSQWLEGGQVCPLYVEVSLTSKCNYRCSYCAFDWYKRGDELDVSKLGDIFLQMKMLGVKSVMFGGEGEPVMHPHFVEAVEKAYVVGLDVALTTNGSLLTKEVLEKMLPLLTWVKVSLNSVDPAVFSRMSGREELVAVTVMKNIEDAVKIRKDRKLVCDIGVQMLITPENGYPLSIIDTIAAARDAKVDYFVLKQYSHHPASKNDFKNPLLADYTKYSHGNFHVIQRRQHESGDYDKCYALPFWSYISSNGDVWACSSHMPDYSYIMGNIYINKLENIWIQRIWDRIIRDTDVKKCRVGCRMDQCNRYLYRLMKPGKHDSFI